MTKKQTTKTAATPKAKPGETFNAKLLKFLKAKFAPSLNNFELGIFDAAMAEFTAQMAAEKERLAIANKAGFNSIEDHETAIADENAKARGFKDSKTETLCTKFAHNNGYSGVADLLANAPQVLKDNYDKYLKTIS